jgi:hypothetical protein
METRTPGTSRKLAVFLAAGGAITTAANWYMLNAHDRYYPKLAVLGPVALVLGCFFLLFPAFSGKSAPGDRTKSAVQVAAVVAGLGLGAANWWLLSHA